MSKVKALIDTLSDLFDALEGEVQYEDILDNIDDLLAELKANRDDLEDYM